MSPHLQPNYRKCDLGRFILLLNWIGGLAYKSSGTNKRTPMGSFLRSQGKHFPSLLDLRLLFPTLGHQVARQISESGESPATTNGLAQRVLSIPAGSEISLPNLEIWGDQEILAEGSCKNKQLAQEASVFCSPENHFSHKRLQADSGSGTGHPDRRRIWSKKSSLFPHLGASGGPFGEVPSPSGSISREQ